MRIEVALLRGDLQAHGGLVVEVEAFQVEVEREPAAVRLHGLRIIE